MAMPEEWKNWATENISRGVKTSDILNILLQNDFTLEDVNEEIPQLRNDLDKQRIYIPWAEKQPTSKADIYTLRKFLTARECSKLINIIKSNLGSSTLTSKISYENTISNRSSCDFS